MLAILSVSSYTAILQLPPLASRASRLLLSMAIAQGMLALLTLTTYHVQVITRLSSACPVWYMWLAAALTSPKDGDPAEDGGEDGVLVPGASERKYAGPIVKYMVLYATIQGGLFACFLPPA